MTMRRKGSAYLTEDSHINGQRSPAAAQHRTCGRLVQRVLGTVPHWVYHRTPAGSEYADP